MDKIKLCEELKNYFIGARNECYYSYDLDKSYFGARIRAYEKVIDTITYWKYTKLINLEHIQHQSKYYKKYNRERLEYARTENQKEYYWCFIQCFNYILLILTYYATLEVVSNGE